MFVLELPQTQISSYVLYFLCNPRKQLYNMHRNIILLMNNKSTTSGLLSKPLYHM